MSETPQGTGTRSALSLLTVALVAGIIVYSVLTVGFAFESTVVVAIAVLSVAVTIAVGAVVTRNRQNKHEEPSEDTPDQLSEPSSKATPDQPSDSSELSHESSSATTKTGSSPDTEAKSDPGENESEPSTTDTAEADRLPDNLVKRCDEIDEGLTGVKRALKVGDLDDAETALSEVSDRIEDLADEDHAEIDLASYRDRVQDLEREVEAEQAKSRIDGLRGSASSNQSAAETYLDDNEYQQAISRLESALESLQKAEFLARNFDIEQRDAIQLEKAEIESLLEKAQTAPNEELLEHLEAGESAVAQGIDRYEADNPAAAVEAFEDASNHYAEAREIATAFEAPERWEVEERWTMLQEYLDAAKAALDQRARSLQNDLQHQLDSAASELNRAEQHAEVNDHVSARESIGKAVRHLGEATQLLEPNTIAAEYLTRYDELAERADDLHESLPKASESGEYRTRDLVESLQMLATKTGESPAPEFVNAYGEYPADAYLEAFGSWPEALAAANLDPVDEAARERRKYTRVEVLDALVELANDLGHAPDKGEMNEHGPMSASPIENRFTDWETALEVAGVAGEELSEPTEVDSDRITTSKSIGENQTEAALTASPDSSAADDGTQTTAATDETTRESTEVVEKLMADMGFE